MNRKITAFMTLLAMTLTFTNAQTPVTNPYQSTNPPERCNFVTANLENPQVGQYDEDCRPIVDYTIEKTLVDVERGGSSIGIPATGTPFPEIQTGDVLTYIIDVNGVIPQTGLQYVDFFEDVNSFSPLTVITSETDISFGGSGTSATVNYNASPVAGTVNTDSDSYDAEVSLTVLATPSATTQYLCNFIETGTVGVAPAVSDNIDITESDPANQLPSGYYNPKIHTEACVQLPGVDPNLIVEKSVSTGPFQDGEIATYTFDITLENYAGVTGFDITDGTGVDITLTDTFDPAFIAYVLDVTPANTNGSSTIINIDDFQNIVTMNVELTQDSVNAANAVGQVVIAAQVDYQDHDSTDQFCNGVAEGSLTVTPSTEISTAVPSPDYSAAQSECITRSSEDVADPEDLSIFKGVYDAGVLIGGVGTDGASYTGTQVTLENGNAYSYQITIASSDPSDIIGGMYLTEAMPEGANITSVTGGTYDVSSDTLFVPGGTTGPITVEIFFTVDSVADANGQCADFENMVEAQIMNIRETSSTLAGDEMTSQFNISSPEGFTSFFEQISFDVEIDGTNPSFDAGGTHAFSLTQNGTPLSVESVAYNEYGVTPNVNESGTVEQFRITINFINDEPLIVEAGTTLSLEWTLDGITGDNVRVRVPNELTPSSEAYATPPTSPMLEYPIVWSPLTAELTLEYLGESALAEVDNSTGATPRVVTNEEIYSLELDANAATVQVGHIDLDILGGDASALDFTLNGVAGVSLGSDQYEFALAPDSFIGTNTYILEANGTMPVATEITAVNVPGAVNDQGSLSLQEPYNNLDGQNGAFPITWIVETHPGLEYWFNTATAMADMTNTSVNGSGEVGNTTTFQLESNVVTNSVRGCTDFELTKTLTSLNGESCDVVDCSSIAPGNTVEYTISLVPNEGAPLPESVTVYDVYDPALLTYVSGVTGPTVDSPSVGLNSLQFTLGATTASATVTFMVQ